MFRTNVLPTASKLNEMVACSPTCTQLNGVSFQKTVICKVIAVRIPTVTNVKLRPQELYFAVRART
jgi:hypothetical protein